MMKGNPITAVSSEQKRLETSKTVSLNPSAMARRRLSETWLNLRCFDCLIHQRANWEYKRAKLIWPGNEFTRGWFCRRERSRWSRRVSATAAAAERWPFWLVQSADCSCTFRYLDLWHLMCRKKIKTKRVTWFKKEKTFKGHVIESVAGWITNGIVRWPAGH